MKAFLLAGGRGERLRPLTGSIPKCLAPINGTALLTIWLDLLDRQGITDVLLNVSHHSDQVGAFLTGRASGPRVRLVVEREPRGNAGTVAANRAFVADSDAFWIFYADNLTNLDLAPMLATHEGHTGVITMCLFHAPDPRAAGIVEMEPDGRIVAFVEKPAQPRGDLANAGIYLARGDLFDHIARGDGVVDFGHDVFPRLLGRMYGHVTTDFLMDIGTPSALSRAAEAWSRLRAREVRA